MKRVLVVIAALLLAVFAGASISRAGQPEACFAASPATPAIASSCTYTATVKGGVDGGGSFVITIDRAGVKRVIRSDALPPEPECYQEGPRTLCPIGIVQPGDVVTVVATETPTLIGVGNPCPVPNPGVPPPILGGAC